MEKHTDFSSDVLTEDAVASFTRMIDDARAADRKRVDEAKAKRDRRQARNLVNSGRSCDRVRWRGNVA